MAVESLELSILAMLARRSNRLRYDAFFLTIYYSIQKTISKELALRTMINSKWLQKILAIESLELSILAMLTRRSNRLSYGAFFLTIYCSYSKDY